MRAFVLIALTGAVALTGSVAFAQSPSTIDTGQIAQAGAPANPVAASDSVSADAPAVAYVSSDALGDASKLKAGDANVVSNGPVPDTRAARAEYGKPLSDAGKHTAPAGN